MKVRLGNKQEIETDQETTHDLQLLRDLLIAEAQELRGKIHLQWEKAQANGGEYPDPAYYGRLLVAKKKVGVNIEQLKNVIHDRRRQENAALNNTLAVHFMEICHERMERELFLALIEEAKVRVRQAEQEVA